MIKNYFKIAFRHLWKNRLSTALNFVGLTVGLASIMTLGFGVYAYHSADAFIENKEALYTLKTVETNGNVSDQTTYPLLGEIVHSAPEVIGATHIQGWNWPWLKVKDIETQKNTKYVDTSFFKVFTLPLKYGNSKTALKNKYDIVISEEVSRQLFGDINPVGQTIQADDSLNLTVQGVFKPINPYSSVAFDVLLPTALLELNPGFKQGADWYNTFATNYLRVKKDTDIEALEHTVLDIAMRNYQNTEGLKKLRLDSFLNYREGYNPTVGKIIKGSLATIFFILLIVVINLLNLNTSIIYNRHKELAVRKIIGSGKRSLIMQFCIENGILVFTALLLAGILFVQVLLPAMNAIYGSRFGNIHFNLGSDYPLLFGYFLIGLLITLTVGVLPTLKIISFPVVTAIKGKIHNSKNSFFVRNAFITVQFALAIIFICTALILNNQIHYMQNVPLGYDAQGVSIVKLNLDFKDREAANSRIQILLEQLKNNPYVQGFATTEVIPTAYHYNYNDFYDPVTKAELNIRKGFTGTGYSKTFGIPLIQGREFDERRDASENNSVMINKKAMEALGWKDIKNKQLTEKGGAEETYNVIGVMEDFHYQDMQKSVEPILHYYGGKRGLGYNNRYLSIKTTPGKETVVLNTLKKSFDQIPSRHAFDYELLESRIHGQYKLLEGILGTVNYVAFLTILISSLGMFGLISLMARKRIKEIGIRKTLGAGVGKIAYLLSKDFIKLVLLACLIAFPIAWYVMDKWLQDFAYRIAIKWWMFLLAGVIALCITAVTVGFQSVKAALANPVKSLRTE
ncbi:ABC transporter permease [Galbibacter pacificus]|uniref:ABC transporter permease n=1 Tax=Galbibacter pacificus TaxID=2996052 RepID=A0ABT6FS10_9FLAO|nr:ABC transporter permease [Galbibacter pacificus]MDG3582850.1 ABC transporter permease [Galbibacter pacificus]MDG3586031.1 ABC transporter permease [Galbibacter pacificus]